MGLPHSIGAHRNPLFSWTASRTIQLLVWLRGLRRLQHSARPARRLYFIHREGWHLIGNKNVLLRSSKDKVGTNQSFHHKNNTYPTKGLCLMSETSASFSGRLSPIAGMDAVEKRIIIASAGNRVPGRSPDIILNYSCSKSITPS